MLQQGLCRAAKCLNLVVALLFKTADIRLQQISEIKFLGRKYFSTVLVTSDSHIITERRTQFAVKINKRTRIHDNNERNNGHHYSKNHRVVAMCVQHADLARMWRQLSDLGYLYVVNLHDS
jgi:hypothetical protein